MTTFGNRKREVMGMIQVSSLVRVLGLTVRGPIGLASVTLFHEGLLPQLCGLPSLSFCKRGQTLGMITVEAPCASTRRLKRKK